MAMDVKVYGKNVEVWDKGGKDNKQLKQGTLQSGEIEETSNQVSTIHRKKCMVTL